MDTSADGPAIKACRNDDAAAADARDGTAELLDRLRRAHPGGHESVTPRRVAIYRVPPPQPVSFTGCSAARIADEG